MAQYRSACLTATLAALSTAAACSRTSSTTTPTPVTLPPASAIHTSPEAIAKARADSARLPWTAADVHFMTGMIGHHSQAIVMASWAASHGASSGVQTLADRIINAQRDEIVTMQQWLRDRSQPVPDPVPGPMMMNMGGMQHAMLMPGMLTDEQMKQLDAARGAEFDKLFLTDMIQHHRGALEMVKELFATPGAGQDELVFKFASDANVDQTTEIARMQRMLAMAQLGITPP